MVQGGVRVAVAVAAHPGPEGDQAAVDRQRLAPDLRTSECVQSTMIWQHHVSDDSVNDPMWLLSPEPYTLTKSVWRKVDQHV